MKMIWLSCLLLVFNTSCGNNTKNERGKAQERLATAAPVEVPAQDGLKKAYFSSGCFWCMEAIYESIKGVKETVSGYAGGHTKNPTYKENNTGRTGHAETVDSNIVDFATLVDVYFGSQNPIQKNGQGPDMGSQYRSIIFFQNDEQKKIIEQKKQVLSKKYKKEIAAEIMPFQKFWKAEGYHQNYEKNHPNDPYIRNVSIPRIKKFKRKFPELLKENASK